MKSTNTQSIFCKFRLVAFLLSSALLTSCGGGGDTTAGIGGTGITSGEITGFGSVFVNGVQFNTDNSQFVVDGEILNSQVDAIAAGLAVGMVARIIGNTDANGSTGSAEQVIYDDEIEGPVAALNDVLSSGGNQKSFSIFGQEVIIDQTSTRFKDTAFSTLAENDVVEVSGFRAPDGSIQATFVEKEGVLEMAPDLSTVEIKGIVSGFTNLSSPFLVNGFTIDMSASPIIDTPTGSLADNDFVEVKGTFYAGASAVTATKIELEDNSFGSSLGEISLQGIVNIVDTTSFFIGNQLVDATSANVSPPGAEIVDGINVEVEGSIVDGTLIAEEIELREGEVELKAVIDNVNTATGQITLTFFDKTLTIDTDGQTRFEDDISGLDISINDLGAPNFVAVKGIETNGLVLATNVKRRSPDDTEIQGRVESHEDGISITILGINHNMAPGITEYQTPSNQTPDFDPTDFFDELVDGNIVQITDAPFDGVADEVELEN